MVSECLMLSEMIGEELSNLERRLGTRRELPPEMREGAMLSDAIQALNFVAGALGSACLLEGNDAPSAMLDRIMESISNAYRHRLEPAVTIAVGSAAAQVNARLVRTRRTRKHA